MYKRTLLVRHTKIRLFGYFQKKNIFWFIKVNHGPVKTSVKVLKTSLTEWKGRYYPYGTSKQIRSSNASFAGSNPARGSNLS